jgi:CHAT domain-containing protein
LWPVADSSTAILMKNFYRKKFSMNLSKAEALRQAQLVLLYGQHSYAKRKIIGSLKSLTNQAGTYSSQDQSKPFSHPFYWAPFILMGDWH